MKKKITLIAFLLILLTSLSLAQYYSADEYYAEGKKLLEKGNYSQAIPLLEKAVKLNPSAANYRVMAEAYKGAKNYPKAVEAYRKEAVIYRQKRDLNAAVVEEQKANALDVKFELYYTAHADDNASKLSLAKGEPLRGCYIGAFIEDDIRLYGDFEKFNQYTGKNHSSFYAYLKYGEPFPYAWCCEIKRLGAIPHIAWEPDSLEDVKDDEYTRNFAKEAAKLNWPVFLRYASEMNGEWTPYTGNPSLYKEKFKLIHNVFEKIAPKVIMVWTPNSIPQSNITDYYPGDDYVDWVGINIYSVHHHGKDLTRNAEDEDPTYLLEYVYKLYSKKKPIQVSEFASTHFCKACDKKVTDFGISKMYQMYGSLPLAFPRVKCIDWFDCDTIREIDYDASSPNDYSLTDDLDIINSYRKLIASEYFLGGLASDASPELPSYTFSPLTEKSVILGQSLICSFVRSYLKKPEITYYLDDVKIKSERPPLYYLEIKSDDFKEGTHTLRADLGGDEFGIIASKQIKFSLLKGDVNVHIPRVDKIKEPVPPEKERSKFLWKEKWGGWHGGGGENFAYNPLQKINTQTPSVENLTPEPVKKTSTPSPVQIEQTMTEPPSINPSPSPVPTEISNNGKNKQSIDYKGIFYRIIGILWQIKWLFVVIIVIVIVRAIILNYL